MATPLLHRSVSDWIYSYQLSAAYRSPWVYDPSGALFDEPDVWEIVRNQTDILAEVNRHNNGVVRPWRVAPSYHVAFNRTDNAALKSSEKLASICHEGIANCTMLDEARWLLAEAPILGRKYALVLWEPVRTSLDGTPPMDWWLPYKIKDIDRRRFHWTPDWVWVRPDGKREPVVSGPDYDYGDGRISRVEYPRGGYLQKSGAHLEMYNTDAYRWERVSEEQRRNLIEYVSYDSEDRVGYGRGWLEAMFFTHYFLTTSYQKIMEGIDRYANGVLIGKLDSLRAASHDRTNATLLSEMENLMRTFRSNHYVILNDGDDIEIKEPAGRGMQFAMEWVQHLLASVARLLNGSPRPAGHNVGGTGARAQAQTEAETSEGFYQQERTALDHVMDRDLLGAFLYHNAENISTLGLGEAKRPKFSSEQIKRQDPQTAMGVITSALGAGMPLLRREAYDRIEFTPPGAEDEVLDPAATMQAKQAEMNDKFSRDQMKDDGEHKDADRKAAMKRESAGSPK